MSAEPMSVRDEGRGHRPPLASFTHDDPGIRALPGDTRIGGVPIIGYILTWVCWYDNSVKHQSQFVGPT